MAEPSPTPPSRRRSAWTDKLSRSGFFLGALLLHLIIFLMIATLVVFKPFIPPSDDFAKTYVPASSPPPPPPQTTVVPVAVPTHALTPPTAVITSAASAAPFTLPPIDMDVTATTQKENPKLTPTPAPSSNNLTHRLSKIHTTVTGWGRSDDDIRNSNGDPHNIKATFPVYVASYADGDWDCNTHLTRGAIDAGSMPDLVAKINEWSHGNITGSVVPTPLKIGSPDLLAKSPPFIFFTGHKDFKLTDQEIQNLQEYLNNGGAIWGDNALAGEGSRFDVAFRREMKRVIPDKDKDFQPIAMSDEIFTKSWFPISKIPSGMNYYAEPLLHIDIDGKLAVIYTPNDYSDLFYMRILPGDTMVQTRNPPPKPEVLITNGMFYRWRGTFFRNFELPSSLAAHQLGMNIIGFLLVRFDKDMLLTP